MTTPGRKPPPEGRRRSAGKAVSVLLLPSELAIIETAKLDGESMAATVRRLALLSAMRPRDEETWAKVRACLAQLAAQLPPTN